MSSYNLLDTPIEYLKGVGPQRAEVLQKELGAFHFRDLLHHFPFRYVDRSRFYTIREITPSDTLVQVRGKLMSLEVTGQKRKKILKGEFMDETGSIELVWFQGIKWMQEGLKIGAEYVVFGKPNIFKGTLSMAHPEIESVAQAQSKTRARLQPVYPSTEQMKKRGLDSKGLYKLTQHLFERIAPNDLPENIPDALLKKYKMTGRYNAMRWIHLPENEKQIKAAQRRLKFEELFLLQLQVLRMRLQRHADVPGALLEKLGPYFNAFYEDVLPFELTGAQKRVLKEIRKDVLSGKQMNRLLQGDVGSGKTVVALMSMLMAVDNQCQACLMAPTEILAQQHFNTISRQLEGLDLKVDLLTGSIKGAERKGIFERLKTGETHILIGTHALLEEKVNYHNLGLVVIDEQHRFGVAQRAKLWQKNIKTPPHVLVMTATPIPRTLAMTVYGDLDVSVIDELPPGRKPIITRHLYDRDRLRIFGFMKEEIAKGRQVYVVYPLIKESEKLDFKDLEDGYESIIRAFPLPEYTVSIVHGQMPTDAKDFEMQRFVKGETDIMVATTVIEVGVDVPNASVMVIESAERFGLAQLHQLRGRVGRGADQSFCLLATKDKLGKEARLRMKTMCETNDGFRIAEVDMKLRGPGEMEGTRQSGHLNFKIADIQQDLPILEEARKSAAQILDADPELNLAEHEGLKRHITESRTGKEDWSKIL